MLRWNTSVLDLLVNEAMGIALQREQIKEGKLPDYELIKFNDDTIES